MTTLCDHNSLILRLWAEPLDGRAEFGRGGWDSPAPRGNEELLPPLPLLLRHRARLLLEEGEVRDALGKGLPTNGTNTHLTHLPFSKMP